MSGKIIQLLLVVEFLSESCVLTVLNDVSGRDGHQNKQGNSSKSTFKNLHSAETVHIFYAERLESIHSFFSKNTQKQNTWNVNDLQIVISRSVDKICDLP